MRQDKRGARAGAWYLLIAAVCAIVVTACGSGAAPGSGSGTGSSPHATASPGSGTRAAKISLGVDVSHGPGTPIVHWTLQCQPAGGTHRDPASACRVLTHAKDPFAPIPKGIMCPMIVEGTKVATVRGSWYGKPINVTMTQGGCWLSRWAEVGQIFN